MFKRSFSICIIMIHMVLFGQETNNYEHGIIRYQASTNSIIKSYSMTVSFSSKVSQFEGKVTELNSTLNLTPLIEKVNELSSEGWEVYTVSCLNNGDANILLYHIRRKSVK